MLALTVWFLGCGQAENEVVAPVAGRATGAPPPTSTNGDQPETKRDQPTGGDDNTEQAAAAGRIQVGLEEGNLAPDIVGEDIDGVKFKLSDYRGKVVLLDFWGHW